MTTPMKLKSDLRAVGLEVDDIWELVNTQRRYPEAVPTLLDWLTHITDRAYSVDLDPLREALIRSLAVTYARPTAAPIMIKLFSQVNDDSGLGIRWAIGNTLSVVADDTVFDEIRAILKDGRFGKQDRWSSTLLRVRATPREFPC